MSNEHPLDEETKQKFHDILTKLSNDDPNFFEIFSKAELKTLESILSEEVQLPILFLIFIFLAADNTKSYRKKSGIRRETRWI